MAICSFSSTPPSSEATLSQRLYYGPASCSKFGCSTVGRGKHPPIDSTVRSAETGLAASHQTQSCAQQNCVVGCRTMKNVPFRAWSDKPAIGLNGGSPCITAMLLSDRTCIPIHSPTPDQLTDFCAPTVAA